MNKYSLHKDSVNTAKKRKMLHRVRLQPEKYPLLPIKNDECQDNLSYGILHNVEANGKVLGLS